MNIRLILFAILACPFSSLFADPDGAALFTQNCSACHQLDQLIVGPSLVEIRNIYQKNPDDFVKWCIAPQKKRQELIEMPSMAHLGEPALRAIHSHLMEITKGVSAKKADDKDPFAFAQAQASRPQVQRIFMPDASPAAMAVALDDRISLCWDAGPCRLRYVWTGGFIDGYNYWRGQGSGLAIIKGKIRYSEDLSVIPTSSVKFLGYDLKDGQPSFRYTSGGISITESYAPLSGKNGFERRFQLSPLPTAPLVMKFPDNPSVEISSTAGTWQARTLTLTPAEASNFTLTCILP